MLALGVADLLQDHLLGGLRTDAADRDRLHGLFDVVTFLDLAHAVDGVGQQLLGVRVLQACGIGHHQPAAEGFVLAVLAVHRHPNVHLATMQAFGGRGQCGLNGSKNDFTVHALFA